MMSQMGHDSLIYSVYPQTYLWLKAGTARQSCQQIMWARAKYQQVSSIKNGLVDAEGMQRGRNLILKQQERLRRAA